VRGPCRSCFDPLFFWRVILGFGRALVTVQAMQTAIDQFGEIDVFDAQRIVLVTALPGSENDHQMFIDLVTLANQGRRVFLVTNDNDLLRYWRPLNPDRPGVVVYTGTANTGVALHHPPGSPGHILRTTVSRDFFRNEHATAVKKLAICTGKLADKYALLVAAKAAEATQELAVRPCQGRVDTCTPVRWAPWVCEGWSGLDFSFVFPPLTINPTRCGLFYRRRANWHF
jgi:hypothetical protein